MQRVVVILLVALSVVCNAQEKPNSSYVDLSYFYGNISRHNNDILHLIKGHPEGFIFSWNKKTFGNDAWEQRYNYPDYGFSFIYLCCFITYYSL